MDVTQDETRQTELLTLQKLMQVGKFQAALSRLDTLLEVDPGFVDALYMRAVCLRYLKRPDAALAALNELKSYTPEFGRAFQEQGHLYRAQNRTRDALEAFQKATQYNPALIASWKAQADLLASGLGSLSDVEAVQAQADRIAALPKELVAIMNFISEKRLLKAETVCRAFLQRSPTHTEAMRLLADIAEKFGSLDEAEFLLESAVEFEPENVQLRLDYIQILRRQQKLQAAFGQAKYLYDKNPSASIFQSQLAISHMQLGNYDRAVGLFEKVEAQEPENAANFTSMGHALKTAGKHTEGVVAYQQAYRASPRHGEAYSALANLKTYTFTDTELKAMLTQTGETDLTYRERIHFLFALGKAHEDKKDYQTSFKFYEEANTLGRKQMRYDAEVMSHDLAAQKETCTAELFARKSGQGFPAKDPIFIVGLPRAGSTLLEQIVASHSQVDGTQELGNILSLAHKLRGRGRTVENSKYPKILHALRAEQLHTFGEKFIEDTKIHRGDAPFFIDKMPNNFRHIGLIHLILPNAKIIDARRHPMACCFSGFKQHFAEGQEFTYGLEQIGQYYRDYVTLMDHWETVLPGKILRVQYEDVVADTETQVRQILDYLDLPFEQACLEFHKTKRSVRTASSEQVRQPIFKSGLEQWRHYEPWLGPLKDALGSDILARYPIEAA